ncbi:MAG: class II fructose-1,6-bisphosphate aldolase [Oscillospiraceae bacterium]|nr:class II fructose-1,6-bisphosphate aldolase [Oscillospiraceae bacterium]
MPLINTKEILQKAYEGNYAVGAFNINNMETIQGIVDAAKEENSPIILQMSASGKKYVRAPYVRKMVEAAIEDANIPIVLHLDHGEDFEICKECIDAGFTSVMIDGSKYSFEENIALTKQVVDYAHERGVVVEAELGKLAGIEDDVNISEEDAVYTNPKEAIEFVQRTGCDSLAIAIGTSHGAFKFKGEAKLRYDILEEIQQGLPGFPIVLHGASSIPAEFVETCNKYGGDLSGAQGVPEEMLRKSAGMAVCKINMDTDLRLAMTAAIRKYFVENPKEIDPRKYIGSARDAVKEMVKHKIINVLGSQNKL